MTFDSTGAKAAWGDPTRPTFAKRFIRQVSTPATRVHIELASVVSGLFQQAMTDGAPVPGTVQGWVAPPKTGALGPQHFGLAFRTVDGLQDIAPLWGFQEQGGWYVYTGNVAKALVLAERSEAERMRATVVAEKKTGSDHFTGRPGEREPGPGDHGDDIVFYKLVWGAPDTGPYWDDWCAGHTAYTQSRLGVKVTGTISADLWRATLPTVRTAGISYGDTGMVVRMLQALLLAYDWDSEVQVTGRWDDVTNRAVRTIQADRGLRVTSDMTLAEWMILTGRYPD